MKKIVMFFGSDRAFVERIPKTYRNLSDIAMQMDDEINRCSWYWLVYQEMKMHPSKQKNRK